MSGGLIDIIRLVIDLYATVILVRLLLQLVQADFFNPISQTIFKITALFGLDFNPHYLAN